LGADEKHQGTAFFVAPGLLLTCAHVVADRSGGPLGRISVHIGGKVKVDAAVSALTQPFPDIALLAVPFLDHPLLAAVQTRA
jgi:hypothetical protein